jgi:hypothetical protein
MMEGPLFDIRNKLWIKMDRIETVWWAVHSEHNASALNLWTVQRERAQRQAPGSRAARKAALKKALRAVEFTSAKVRRAEARLKAAREAFSAAETAALIDWNARRR